MGSEYGIFGSMARWGGLMMLMSRCVVVCMCGLYAPLEKGDFFIWCKRAYGVKVENYIHYTEELTIKWKFVFRHGASVNGFSGYSGECERHQYDAPSNRTMFKQIFYYVSFYGNDGFPSEKLVIQRNSSSLLSQTYIRTNGFFLLVIIIIIINIEILFIDFLLLRYPNCMSIKI